MRPEAVPVREPLQITALRARHALVIPPPVTVVGPSGHPEPERDHSKKAGNGSGGKGQPERKRGPPRAEERWRKLAHAENQGDQCDKLCAEDDREEDGKPKPPLQAPQK